MKKLFTLLIGVVLMMQGLYAQQIQFDSDINDQTIDEGTTFFEDIDLDLYVTNGGTEYSFVATGGVNLIPSYSNQAEAGNPHIIFVSVADEDFHGTETLTIIIEKDGNQDVQEVTFTVNPVNDKPTIDAIADPVPIDEDADVQIINLTGITDGDDFPGDDQVITITASSSADDGTIVIPDPTVTYTSPNSTGQLSYKPIANAFGTVTVTVIVSDDNGTAPPENNDDEETSITFQVQVAPVNDPPEVETNLGMAVKTGGDRKISVNMLEATDPDHEAAELTYEITQLPAIGILINSQGSNTSFTQSDINQGYIKFLAELEGDPIPEGTVISFDFTVKDDEGETTDEESFFITITDGAPPVVTYSTATYDNGGDNISLTSSKAGTAYIIIENLIPGEGVDEFDLESAKNKNRGASADVLTDGVTVQIGTDNLVPGKYYGFAIDEEGDISEQITEVITIIDDGTAPVVTVEPQVVSNIAGQKVALQSSEAIGYVYIILEGEPQATITNFDAAIADKKGAKKVVTIAATNISISTYELEPGNYNAYAVDDPGVGLPKNISIKATGIEVTDGFPPVAEIVSMSSSNPVDKSAAIGNIITLTIVTDEPIQEPTVTIAGNPADIVPGVDAAHWTATYELDGSEDGGLIPFTLDFDDLAGNSAEQKIELTDDSRVTFYPFPPEIDVLTIIAENDPTDMAIPGEKIIFNIESDVIIKAPTVTITSSTANPLPKATVIDGGDGTTWTLEYTMSLNENNGDVTFTVDFENLVETDGTQLTNADITDGSSVEYDKVLPDLDVSMISTNDNDTEVANSSDQVILTIVADDAINEPFVTFVGHAPASIVDRNNDGITWDITYQLVENDYPSDQPVVFELDYSDIAGNDGPTLNQVNVGDPVYFFGDDLEITDVYMTSPDGESLYVAKDGNDIKVTFISDVRIQEPTVTIAGETAVPSNPSGDEKTWQAIYNINAGDAGDEDLSFTIDAEDLSGNTIETITTTDDGKLVKFYNPDPAVSTVEMTSNYGVGTHAKVGHIVTLMVTTEVDIQQPTVTIAGKAENADDVVVTKINNRTWKATYEFEGDEAAPYDNTDPTGVTIDFTFDYKDVAGNMGTTVTVADADKSVKFDNAVPSISNVKMVSNNHETDVAKVSDDIILTFYVDEPVPQPNISINSIIGIPNTPVNAADRFTITSTDNQNWHVVYELISDDDEGNVTFSIKAQDYAGNPSATVNTLDEGGVEFTKTQPTANPVTMSAQNSPTNYAIDGEKVTLNFTTSTEVETPVVTIAGESAAVTSLGGNDWKAELVMDKDYMVGAPAGSPIDFAIDLMDIPGNAGITIVDVTTGSKVLFDEVKPTIESAVMTSTENANGGSPNYLAKDGDEIKLVFKSSEKIKNVEVTIAGTAVTNLSSSTDGKTWTAKRDLLSTDLPATNGEINGALIPFTIDYDDIAGNSGNTHDELDDEDTRVTLDRQAPIDVEITMVSNSVYENKKVAKVGDAVSVNIITDEPIKDLVESNVKISKASGGAWNQSIDVRANDDTDMDWSAVYVMQTGDAEGNVEYTVTLTDLAGNSTTITNVYADAEPVVFSDVDPDIQTLTMKALSGTVTDRAKDGQWVELTIVTSKDIQTPTVLIAGQDAQEIAGVDAQHWTAKLEMEAAYMPSAVGAVEGVEIPIQVTYRDIPGNLGETAVDVDGDPVIFDITGPSMDVLTMESNNVDFPKVSSDVHTITLDFESNEDISTPTVTFEGNSATSLSDLGDGDATTWRATYDVKSTDAQGDIDFTITYKDIVGNGAEGGVQSALIDDTPVMNYKAKANVADLVITLPDDDVPEFVKVGDDIVFDIETDREALEGQVVVTINGGDGTAVATKVGNDLKHWTATYQMKDGDMAALLDEDGELIPFTVSFTDFAAIQSNVYTGGSIVEEQITFDNDIPDVDVVKIWSDNAQDYAAEVNSEVYLRIESDENILEPTVTVFGNPVDLIAIDADDTEWETTYIIRLTDPAGPVTFNIDYTDFAGNPGVSKNATTDGSSVEVIKDAPAVNVASIRCIENAEPSLARLGQTIELTFETNVPVLEPTVTIAGNVIDEDDVDNLGGGKSWIATYVLQHEDIMPIEDAGSVVPFIIAVKDIADNVMVPERTTTTDGTSVTFDESDPVGDPVTMQNISALYDPLQAKVGDIIEVKVTTNEEIQNFIVDEFGFDADEADVSNVGNVWTVSYELVANDATGQIIPFEFSYEDLAGNRVTGIEDLTNENIRVTFWAAEPELTTVSISSDNDNSPNALAMVGDVIYLNFTSERPLQENQFEIYVGTRNDGEQNSVAAVRQTDTEGLTWEAAHVLQEVDDPGLLTFSIRYMDFAGNDGTRTLTTDGSAITFIKDASDATITNFENLDPDDYDFAKVDDVIELEFTVDHETYLPSISFFVGGVAGEGDVAIDGNGFTWTATYTLSEDDTDDSDITFLIEMEDLAGNVSQKSDLDGQSAIHFYKSEPPLTLSMVSTNDANPEQAIEDDEVILTITSNDDREILKPDNFTFASGDQDDCEIIPTIWLTDYPDPNDYPGVTPAEADSWTIYYTLGVADQVGDEMGIIVPFDIDIEDVAGNVSEEITEVSVGETDVTYIWHTPVADSYTLLTTNEYNENVAAIGDVITLTIIPDVPIKEPIVYIMGEGDLLEVVESETIENAWVATYVMKASDPHMAYIEYWFQIEDLIGNTSSIYGTFDEDINGKQILFYRDPAVITVNSTTSDNEYNNLINPNEKIAKVGDEITIKFETDHELYDAMDPIVLINDSREVDDLTYSAGDDEWTAVYTLTGGEVTNGRLLQYSIGLTDIAGNVTDPVITDTDIEFYEIPPTITSNYLVSNNPVTTALANKDHQVILTIETSHIVDVPTVRFGENYDIVPTSIDQVAPSSTWTVRLDLDDAYFAHDEMIDYSIDIVDVAGNPYDEIQVESDVMYQKDQPIAISVTFSSFNSYYWIAKDDDVVSVDFTTDVAINQNTIMAYFGDENVDNTYVGQEGEIVKTGLNDLTHWSARFTMRDGIVASDNDQIDANRIHFYITFEDLAGTPSEPVIDITVGDDVYYDNTDPIEQTVSIYSGNQNPVLAMDGNTVFVNMIFDEPVMEPQVEIYDHAASVVMTDVDGYQWLASRTMNESEDDIASIPFVIDVMDLVGNDIQVTAVTDASNVLYDKTDPTFTNIVLTPTASENIYSTESVQIDFTVSEDLLDVPEVLIDGNSSNTSDRVDLTVIDPHNYSAKFTMDGSDTPGDVEFVVNVNDLAGNPGMLTTTGATFLVPNINNVTMYSGNPYSPFYANLIGENANVYFAVDLDQEPEAYEDVKFNGRNAEATFWDRDGLFKAKYKLTDIDPEGYVSFTAKFTVNGIPAIVSETMDGSWVIFDKTPPELEDIEWSIENPFNSTVTDIAGPGTIVTAQFTMNEHVQDDLMANHPDDSDAGEELFPYGFRFMQMSEFPDLIVAQDDDNTIWKATYEFQESNNSDYYQWLGFVLKVKDKAGNKAKYVSNLTDDSGIFFDNRQVEELTVVDMYSNNPGDNSRATIGDEVTIVFETSEDIYAPTVNVFGTQEAEIYNNGSLIDMVEWTQTMDNEWSAKYVIQEADAQPNDVFIGFSTDMYDIAGNDQSFNSTGVNAPQLVVLDTRPPEITSVTMHVVNKSPNSTIAKAGEQVQLTIEVDEPCKIPVVYIDGVLAMVLTEDPINKDEFIAKITTSDANTYGFMNFQIDFEDIVGNAGIRHEDVTMGEKVFFDNVKPEVDTYTMESDRGDGSNAQAGDVITLTITMKEEILPGSLVMIGTGVADLVSQVDEFTAVYEMTLVGGEIVGDGYLPFSIGNIDGDMEDANDVIDLAGNINEIEIDAMQVMYHQEPPQVTGIWYDTNNDDDSEIDNGTTITITYTVDKELVSSSVDIRPNNVFSATRDATFADGEWTVTYMMDEITDEDGLIHIVVNMTDLGGLVTNDAYNTGIIFDTEDPVIEQLYMISNNPYTDKLATQGDVITLFIETNEPIRTPTVKLGSIDGVLVVDDVDKIEIVKLDDDYYYAQYVVEYETDAGEVPFILDIEDIAGNPVQENALILDEVYDESTRTIIDRVAPEISVHMETSNTVTPNVIKANEVITLIIELDDPSFIYETQPSMKPIVKVLGNNADFVDGDGTSWFAEYTMKSTDVVEEDLKVTFTIEGFDALGNSQVVSDLDDDGEQVLFYNNPQIVESELISYNLNSNKAAKPLDLVELTFTTNLNIQEPNVYIGKHDYVAELWNDKADVVQGIDAKSWTATYSMKAGAEELEGPIEYRIVFDDLAGNHAASNSVSDVVFFENPPIANVIMMSSDNVNNTGLATEGDKIKLQLNTNVEIMQPIVILGESIDPIILTRNDNNEATWTAEHILNIDDAYLAEGEPAGIDMPFSINFQDLAGNWAENPYTEVTVGDAVVYDPNAPQILDVTIETDNANSALAIMGNTITVSFTTDEPINDPQVKIAGVTTADPEMEDGKWVATFVLGDELDNGDAVPYQIMDISDPTGNVTATIGSVDSDILFDNEPPVASLITMSSNNLLNTTKAKVGNLITVDFETEEPIQTPTIKIAGKTSIITKMDESAQVWQATYVLKDGDYGDLNDLISLKINFLDLGGNPALANNVTVGSRVYFDKDDPRFDVLTIVSNNDQSDDQAVAGNVVTINFTTNEELSEAPTVTVDGDEVIAEPDGDMMWEVNYTTDEETTEGIINFEITIVDLVGNDFTATQTGTTDASTVNFNNTVPSADVSIYSNNEAHKDWAKVGDLVTLSIITDIPVQKPEVEILNAIGDQTATVVGTDENTWTAIYLMKSGDEQGNIEFTMNMKSLGGLVADEMTVTTDESNVIFRQDKPTAAVTIESKNAKDPTLAKDDDNVEITITADDGLEIENVVVTVNTNNVTNISNMGDGNPSTWKATYKMDADVNNNGPLAITVDFDDYAGNHAVQMDATTDESIVIFDKKAPMPALLRIESDNEDIERGYTYARIGDVVTLVMDMDEDIEVPVVTIADHTGDLVDVKMDSDDNDIWTAKYTMDKDRDAETPETLIKFSVSFEDMAGNTYLATTSTDGSEITFDKTASNFESVSISSTTNPTPTLAKVGDEIELLINTDDHIFAPTVTFNGLQNEDVVIERRTTGDDFRGWAAIYEMQAGDQAGIITYDILISDYAGNTQLLSDVDIDIDTQVEFIEFIIDPLQITMESSRDDNKNFANVGDMVTLTIVTETGIQEPTVTIAGHPAKVVAGVDAMHWTAWYIMHDGDLEGEVAYTLQYLDLAGNDSEIYNYLIPNEDSRVYFYNSDPVVESLEIYSDNDGLFDIKWEQYATYGSVVYLDIVMDRFIEEPVVTFGDGQPADDVIPGGDPAHWTALRTMQSEDVILASNPANITGVKLEFTLNTKDLAGNPSPQYSNPQLDDDEDSKNIVWYDVIPPETSYNRIFSDNPISAKFATVGHVVSFEIRTNENVRAPIVQIANREAIAVVDANDPDANEYTRWIAVVELDESAPLPIEGQKLPFQINLVDIAGRDVQFSNNGIANLNGFVIFDNTAPDVENIVVNTSNQYPTVARVGDEITIDFETTENVTEPIVTISSNIADIENLSTAKNANIWRATYMMTAADDDGQEQIPYSIAVIDSAGIKTETGILLSDISFYIAPTASTVTMYSDNTIDDAYANDGHEVTLDIIANTSISEPDVTIGGIAAESVVKMDTEGLRWIATRVMNADDDEGPIDFSAEFIFDGTTEPVTITDINGSTSQRVKFDMTPPVYESVTIQSVNSSNPSVATIGETVDVIIVADDGIQEPIVTIEGRPTVVTAVDETFTTWTLSYTLSEADVNLDGQELSIDASITDRAGNGPTPLGETEISGSVVFYKEAAPIVYALQSDNANREFAKIGDEVILTLFTNIPIDEPTISIANHTVADGVTVLGSGQNWSARYKLTEDDSDLDGMVIPVTVSFFDINHEIATATNLTTAELDQSVTFDISAPVIDELSLESDREASPLVAQVGDQITLTLITDEAIERPDVTIEGADALVRMIDDAMHWEAYQTIVDVDEERDVQFSIDLMDLAGNPTSAVTGVVNGTNVGLRHTPPEVESLTMTSSNTDDIYVARPGDRITIRVVADQPIQNLDVKVFGKADVVDLIGAGSIWEARYILKDGDPIGPIPFSVDFDDMEGIPAITKVNVTEGEVVVFARPLPKATLLVMESNNSTDQMHATTGDVVKLTLTTSRAIITPTVEIGIGSGDDIVLEQVGEDWVASYIMTESDIEGEIPFNLTIKGIHPDDIDVPITEVTPGNSAVVFDKTNPIPVITAGIDGVEDGDYVVINSLPIRLTFTNDTEIDGLTNEDIEIKNEGVEKFDLVSDLEFTETGYRFNLPLQDLEEGIVSIGLPLGVCTDMAGNPNVEKIDNDAFTIRYTKDRTLAATIKAFDGEKEIVNGGGVKTDMVHVKITFNRPVSETYFIAADVDLEGSASIVEGTFARNADRRTYEFDLQLEQQNITIKVNEGVCYDAFGIPNQESVYTMKYKEGDEESPEIVEFGLVGETDNNTNIHPVQLMIRFNEAVKNFTPDDMIIYSTGDGTKDPIGIIDEDSFVKGSSNSYNFSVIFNETVGNFANATIYIAAGDPDDADNAPFTDLVGNVNDEWEGNFTYDNQKPVASMVTTVEELVYNTIQDKIVVTCDEPATVFIVKAGAVSSIPTYDDLFDLIGTVGNYGTIAVADENAEISTYGLQVGTYYAYAVDMTGNISDQSAIGIRVQAFNVSNITFGDVGAEFCPGDDDVRIVATPPNGKFEDDVEWLQDLTDEGEPGVAIFSPSLVPADLRGKVIKIVYAYGGEPKSLDVKVRPIPVPKFETANNDNVIQFIDYSDNTDANTVYAWNFGTGADFSSNRNPIVRFQDAGAYNVTLTLKDNLCPGDGDGYKSEPQTVMIYEVSVDDLFGTKVDLGVYPNPNDGRFSLNVTSAKRMNDVQLRVINITGQVIMTDEVTVEGFEFTKELDISEYTAGMYVLEIQIGDQTITRRVAVTRK